MRPSLAPLCSTLGAQLLAATFALAGLALTTASAQVGGQPTAPPGAAQPPAPAGPPALPVPDGPVVHKQELEGGLLVEDIKIGDGYELKSGGLAVAYYHGTLKADPTTVFDSAFERGEPMAFPLGAMIAGWQKGLPGMKVGGIRRLTVPAALGYGSQGRGPKLPPNSDLVFVVQLVDVLQIEDVKIGDGEAAGEQCVAVAAHTVKDKDGKEVEKSDAAHPYIWIPGEMVPPGAQFDTMQQALAGMRVGGKRRLSIPGAMNVTPPQLGVARPQNVPITVEIDLIAVRNLPGGGGRRR